MCIIIDANMMGLFLQEPQNEDMKVIHQWLQRRGKLAYSDYGKLGYETLGTFKRWLMKNERLGRAKKINATKVKQEMENLPPNLASNDSHILGLAKAAGVSVLCTNDSNLEKDFKSRAIIGGGIYKHKGHKHLLKPDMCP